MNLDKNDEFIVLYAVRYCLGRTTYAVSDCVEWLQNNWQELSYDTQVIIQRAIEAEFRRDDEARSGGYTPLSVYPLGMDIDRNEWLKVRSLWL